MCTWGYGELAPPVDSENPLDYYLDPEQETEVTDLGNEDFANLYPLT
jgi:hypothetical protein